MLAKKKAFFSQYGTHFKRSIVSFFCFFCPFKDARDVCRMYTCADFLNFRTLSPRKRDSHSIESTLSETPPVNQREVRLNVN
jgi:hypothetical protein